MRLILAAVALVLSMPALAHNSWISRGAHRNAAGDLVLRRRRLLRDPEGPSHDDRRGLRDHPQSAGGDRPAGARDRSFHRSAAFAGRPILALQTPRRVTPLLLRPAAHHLTGMQPRAPPTCRRVFAQLAALAHVPEKWNRFFDKDMRRSEESRAHSDWS